MCYVILPCNPGRPGNPLSPEKPCFGLKCYMFEYFLNNKVIFLTGGPDCPLYKNRFKNGIFCFF